MKKIFLLLLYFPLVCSGQHHVDILKVNYGETFKNKFEGFNTSTQIKSFEAEFILPIPLTENQAIISGIDHSNDRLQLFPQSEFTQLYNTTLKLGLASIWNEKWSSSIVLLPKIASDYKDFSGKDFYMGIYATFAVQQKENLKYRFGLYASTEAYGVFMTPIFGWHYLSQNEKFEMNMSLPISGIMTYDLGAFSVGMDYFGISRSFRIHQTDEPVLYADLSSLRFAGFMQMNTFKKQILWRAKLGYSTNDYQVYEDGEKINLGLSAFNFGDSRTQLNPNIKGSVFFKLEVIYRFYL